MTKSEQKEYIDSYTDKWNEHLKGTEKLAYPSFSDSKLDPMDIVCFVVTQINLK